MSWLSRYHPPEQNRWQGRADLPDEACFFQTMRFLNLTDKPETLTQPSFAILGFACDEGIRRNYGRAGASEGPNAIRQALAKIPVSAKISCADAGDITCSDKNLEESQSALAEAVSLLLKQHYVPIVLGGGHELAWGHFQGISQCLSIDSLAIINFDAHFDMRPIKDKSTSGTPFLQIANFYQLAKQKLNYNCIGIQPSANIALLFETAKKYHVNYLLAEEIFLQSNATLLPFIQRIIDQHKFIYVSICLDVFASFAAPGVSAPQPLGITPWQVIPALRQLAQSGKVVAYDFAEMSPRYDIDNRTAKLAAVLIYEIMQHHRGIYAK